MAQNNYVAKLYSSEYFKERLWPNYTALNILRSVCVPKTIMGQIIQL